MEFRILGQLEVDGPHGPVELRADKQRALLAALLLRANGTVSADALIDALWGERPPLSARKLVQVYVSRLRRALGDGEIRTRAPGYVLAVDPDELDSARFERLLARGREALADGNARRARQALGEALALWRGPALGELAYEPFARPEAERLDELRLAAIEARIEADLALGEHESIVVELRSLVERHPLRERLRRQLMLALYRAGRQAEALEAFGDARRVLREELGLDPGEELRGLQGAILRHDPALTAPAQPDRPRTNLPSPLTALVGRHRELVELTTLVRRDEVRLLSLVGAGGSGKTRLALEVAHALVDEVNDGVFVVDLVPVRDVGRVPAAFAAALGLDPASSGAQWPALHRALRAQELVIVVDNAEHLPELGALLVELLREAPALTLLVTSRAVLHVSGEHVYPVAPLDEEAAIELFGVRARAADPSVVADRQQVAAICEAIDRLPLAIELAATHVRTLTLEALHVRLAERLALLTAGPRDLPARQRTLRATMDWSYELLSSEQQSVFRRLAVFAGEFTIDAATAVAGADLATATSLVEQSLLRRGAEGRLSLLQTLREYALDRLRRAGEEPTTRRRHALHFTEVVRSANLGMEADGSMRYDLVVPEEENIRAAIEWARDAGEAAMGLELATLQDRFWVNNNPLEAKERLAELLELEGDLPPGLLARALRAHGTAHVAVGEYDVALALYEASLREYRGLGDERGVAIVLQRIADEQVRRGNLAAARSLAEESYEIVRRIEFARGESVALSILASVCMAQGGEDDRALELLTRCVDVSMAADFAWGRIRNLHLLSRLLLRLDRAQEAGERLREALPLLEKMGDRVGSILVLAELVQVAAQSGDAGRAGRLWGAIEAEEARAAIGTRLGRWEQIQDDYAGALLAVAGPTFEAARAEGRRLSLAAAVERAATG